MEQSKPKTILIVEDDEAVRQAIAEVVQLYGWQVLEASNGIHGLRVFRNQLPDIVLADVVMAGFDGFQLAAGIKSISPQSAGYHDDCIWYFRATSKGARRRRKCIPAQTIRDRGTNGCSKALAGKFR
jgi:CheY-like chemotaxis protein